MAVCNQITFLIIHYISFRFVTLPKVTDVPIKTSDILGITVSSKFLNFRRSFFLFLKYLQASNLTSMRLSTYIPTRLGCVIAFRSEILKVGSYSRSTEWMLAYKFSFSEKIVGFVGCKPIHHILKTFCWLLLLLFLIVTNFKNANNPTYLMDTIHSKVTFHAIN